jgi:hypothetical protein
MLLTDLSCCLLRLRLLELPLRRSRACLQAMCRCRASTSAPGRSTSTSTTSRCSRRRSRTTRSTRCVPFDLLLPPCGLGKPQGMRGRRQLGSECPLDSNQSLPPPLRTDSTLWHASSAANSGRSARQVQDAGQPRVHAVDPALPRPVLRRRALRCRRPAQGRTGDGRPGSVECGRGLGPAHGQRRRSGEDVARRRRWRAPAWVVDG